MGVFKILCLIAGIANIVSSFSSEQYTLMDASQTWLGVALIIIFIDIQLRGNSENAVEKVEREIDECYRKKE